VFERNPGQKYEGTGVQIAPGAIKEVPGREGKRKEGNASGVVKREEKCETRGGKGRKEPNLEKEGQIQKGNTIASKEEEGQEGEENEFHAHGRGIKGRGVLRARIGIPHEGPSSGDIRTTKGPKREGRRK